MSKQEISQEVLRKIWTECETEIVEILQKKMEEALEKEDKPFEVKVPKDIDTYYTIDVNKIRKLGEYREWIHRYVYECGEAFKTEEEAKRYDKERLLLFKIKKWAEIQNGDFDGAEELLDYYISYDFYKGKGVLAVNSSYKANSFLKLPYFKTEKIAQACIDEFGDEIWEVLVNESN